MSISLNCGICCCCKIISCNLVVFVPFLFSSNGDCQIVVHSTVPFPGAEPRQRVWPHPHRALRQSRWDQNGTSALVPSASFGAGGMEPYGIIIPFLKKNMVQYDPNLGGFIMFHPLFGMVSVLNIWEWRWFLLILENYTCSNARWDWMFKNFWHLIACFCLALSTFLKQTWRLNQLSNLDMTSMFGWWFQCMYCSFISEKKWDQHWLIFARWVCHHMPPTSHDQRLICVRWYMLFI